MKVLMVVPSISRIGGGVSESVRLLALALRKTPGVELEVVTLRDRSFEADRHNWGDVQLKAFPMIGPSNFGFSPQMLKYVSRSDADLMHVHGLWMFHCFCVATWAFLRRRRYLVTPHGMLEAWILGRSTILKRAVSVIYQDRFLANAAAFHVLTTKEIGDVRAKVHSAKCVTIPNAVSPRAYRGGRPKWWKDEFEGKTVYLFFGRIHEKKGWRELLTAWGSLCDSNENFGRRSLLVFGGWIDGSPDFTEVVGKISLDHSNVLYVGPQYGDEKDLTLSSATFFLLPSKSEGLPMAVLEAWAAAIPVLMTEECNLSIGFSEGGAIRIGLVPTDIEIGLKLADSLNEEEVKAMANSAKGIVTKHFSPTVVGNQMVWLYKRIIENTVVDKI